MYYSKVGMDKFIIRLARGEKINESIKKFAQLQHIVNASYSGIGSTEDPVLAHYLVNTKKYSEKNVTGVFEVASLTGNIAMFENQPLVHSHIVISDENMQALAGHLVESIVSATLEIVLIKFDTQITKSFDESIGLKLYNLIEEL